MSQDDFNVACPSSIGDGTLNTSQSYQYDFGKRTPGLYEIRFSFISSGSNSIIPSSPAILQLSGLPIINNFTTALNNVYNSSVNLGILFPVWAGTTTGFFQTVSGDNHPVLVQISNQSEFTLKITDITGASYVDNGLAQINEYFCVLNFKKISS